MTILAEVVQQATSSASQDRLWDVVGLVFIAEFVLPPLVKGAKAIFVWFRDLRDLREDLYEPTEDEDTEDEYEEGDDE